MRCPKVDSQNGSNEFNIVIINDLHMGEGRNALMKTYDRAHRIHFEAMFGRFLSHLDAESGRRGKKWRIIIAGDMVDFLQVTRVPDEPLFDLRKSEREYGLGTSPEKTVWKMKLLMQDHKKFFRSLAWFLSRGHRCTIISGNHDIEWTIPETQQAFRKEIKSYFPAHQNGQDGNFTDVIEFCPWFYYEPGLIWVEHGHQYDGMNSFDYLFAPYLPDSDELMLPVGSLLVRYLLNKLDHSNYFDYDFRSAFDYIRQYFFSFFCTSNLVKHICRFPYILDKVKKFKKEDLIWLRERNEMAMNAEAKRFGIDDYKINTLKKLWVPSALYNKDKLENLKSFVTYNVGNIWRRMAFVIQKQLEVRYVVFGHTHKAESLLLTPDGTAKYTNSGAWAKALYDHPNNGRLSKVRNLMYTQVFKDEGNKLALMKWRDDIGQGERVNIPRHASAWN